MRRAHYYSVAATLLLVSCALLSGCNGKDHVTDNDKVVGSGNIVSQVRPVGSFNAIVVTNFASVSVTQDSTESLRIEADDNIINIVTTTVAGGTLSVGLPAGSYSNVTVRVYASMRTVVRLESSGAAEFQSVGDIHTDAMTCHISGAGTIRLTGSATTQTVEITGAGSVNNFGFTTARSTALVTGSGNIEVHATERLDATITGTGSILYTGNPVIVNKSITGIGTIQASH